MDYRGIKTLSGTRDRNLISTEREERRTATPLFSELRAFHAVVAPILKWLASGVYCSTVVGVKARTRTDEGHTAGIIILRALVPFQKRVC